MIYAAVLAGGKGTRMGNTEMPKQFLMLGNKPIFIHTLEQFLLNSEINKILLLCPKEWISHSKDTIKKYIPDTSNIEVVGGGSTRHETVLNACKYIDENYGINDDDIIITHDAVRPFLTQRIIKDNIEAAKTIGACDTVIAASDTIVESIDGKHISSIPIRSTMYQGQTPQSFNIKKMIKVFASLSKEEQEILTDACKAFVIKGEKVGLVNGEVFNIKVTTLHDLKMSNAILTEGINND